MIKLKKAKQDTLEFFDRNIYIGDLLHGDKEGWLKIGNTIRQPKLLEKYKQWKKNKDTIKDFYGGEVLLHIED